jgi:hypothetical protein
MATDRKAAAQAAARRRAQRFAKANPGTEKLRRFVRSFDKFPADVRAELRPKLKASAIRPLAQAKVNAAWSSRIPKAIRVQVSFAKKKAGVRLVVNRKKAPHARPLEKLGRRGRIRHPVPGLRAWVSQPSRPFLWPAAQPWLKDADQIIGAAVDDAAAKHGFK